MLNIISVDKVLLINQLLYWEQLGVNWAILSKHRGQLDDFWNFDETLNNVNNQIDILVKEKLNCEIVEIVIVGNFFGAENFWVTQPHLYLVSDVL